MPKIVLVTYQKGRTGKSTLTFNLAQNISKNSKVAVLEFDLPGSLSQLKEFKKGYKLPTHKINKNKN
jgi:chromosome partitioning protein